MKQKSNHLLDAALFVTKLSEQTNAVIVDVRTPGEFASGHIKGAINLDIQNADFNKEVAKLDPLKSYFVYCRSGGRSAAAVRIMAQTGCVHIFELRGGALAAPELLVA